MGNLSSTELTSLAEDQIDVVVVGSGAGALTAAISAHDHGNRVVVIEKGSQYGGTSAMSGGGIWIPNHGKPSTVDDSANDAFTYLRACVEDDVSDEMLNAYLDGAIEMLRYVEDKTHLAFDPQDSYPDYYQAKPGAKSGGRTLDPIPYKGNKLQAEFKNLRGQHPQTVALGRFGLTMAEGRKVFSKEPGGLLNMAVVMLRYWADVPARLKSKRDNRLVLGNALVGRLRRSLMDRCIPLFLDTPMEALNSSNQRVTGVQVKHQGKSLEIQAKHGVILAAGGFEHNQAMRDSYLPRPSLESWSAGNADNTGDAIQAAMDLGADTAMMQHAWWAPAVKVEKENFSRILFIEKSLPGLIFINAEGKRFGNEAAPYQDYGPCVYHSEHGFDADTNTNAYGIFDANYRKKFMFGPMLQGEVSPDNRLASILKDGFFEKADTIAELAEKIGLDADTLNETIGHFNEGAKVGVDSEFRRGDSVHDQYYGDKNQQPNHCLAELNKAPYYAVKIFPGDLGTKGGLVINTKGQVKRKDGSLMSGLYAIGNSSASVMGSSYPGAGSTLGPAMTFGFLAGRDISGVKEK